MYTISRRKYSRRRLQTLKKKITICFLKIPFTRHSGHIYMRMYKNKPIGIFLFSACSALWVAIRGRRLAQPIQPEERKKGIWSKSDFFIDCTQRVGCPVFTSAQTTGSDPSPRDSWQSSELWHPEKREDNKAHQEILMNCQQKIETF